MAWDSPLGGFADLVGACAAGVDASRGTMQLEELVVDAPIELQTSVRPDGTVSVAVAPPRQATPTSVMPVLHRLRIRVEADQ